MKGTSAGRTTYSVHEAKTHLSRLLVQVEAGEEVVIRRGPHPVARLVPYEAGPAVREPGFMRGRIWIAEDFDDPLPEFEEYM